MKLTMLNLNITNRDTFLGGEEEERGEEGGEERREEERRGRESHI